MAETCSVCDAEFATPADLVGHMKSHGKDPVEMVPNPVPPEARWFSCALCGAAFDAPEMLAAHNRTTHPVAPATQ
jgi:hypothetical protein